MCTPKVSSDRAPGDEAVQVSVTVDESCISEVYTSQALHDLMKQRLSLEATKQLGAGFVLVGDIEITVKQSQGGTLQVRGSGTWYAAFSEDCLHQLAQSIAGKSRQEATHLLLQTAGVHQVEELPATLPGDAAHIHVVMLYVPGVEETAIPRYAAYLGIHP